MKKTYLLILLTITTVNFAVTQNQDKDSILRNWEEYASADSEQIIKEGLNFQSYLYKGTNLKREPVTNFDDYPQKIIFYWTTECRYCKKELDDLERIIIEQPSLKDSILIVMRVVKQNKEWSLKKGTNDYTVFKGNREFLKLPVPLLFLSEEILEKSTLRSAPNTLFLNDDQEIEFIKSAYFVSKKKSEIEEINYEFLKWKINKHLDPEDS